MISENLIRILTEQDFFDIAKQYELDKAEEVGKKKEEDEKPKKKKKGIHEDHYMDDDEPKKKKRKYKSDIR